MKCLLLKFIHIECNAVAYKMNLKYDGQYQMIEISRFNFPRNNVDDVLLLSAILPQLNQMKEIIENTITSIYNSTNNNSEQSTYLIPYTRQACKIPVPIIRQ